jgi:hypothetical protein
MPLALYARVPAEPEQLASYAPTREGYGHTREVVA